MTTINFYEEIEDHQRKLIVDALNHCHGNKTKAAELLMVNRTTLVQRLKSLGLGHLVELPKSKKLSAELESEPREFPAPETWLGKYKKKKKKTK